jgi:chemotaxis-related protein WspB
MLMLCFSLFQGRYVINTDAIIEILPKVNLRQFTHASPHFLGLLNFGGLPIPIFDLRHIVEGSFCRNAMDSRLILLHHVLSQEKFGVVVERASETVDIPFEDFTETHVKFKNLPFLGGLCVGKEETFQEIKVDPLYHFVKNL